MQVSSALAEIDALGRVRKKEERGKKYSEATSFLKIYLLHKSAAQSFITALPCPALGGCRAAPVRLDSRSCILGAFPLGKQRFEGR